MKVFISLLFVFLFSYSSTVIGKYDKIDLPQLGLSDLKAKIDTGARTSSLHCSLIYPIGNGRVAFTVLDDSYKKFIPKTHFFDISRVSKVKSSNGTIQKRYFVKMNVILFGKEYLTEFSLTNRKDMNFPILLGRNFLKKGFYVDVSKENISFDKKYDTKK